MSTSYAFLGLLNNQPNYGYTLKRDYDLLFSRDKPLAFGQVYATLSRLLRDEKICIETADQGSGPERKKYSITAAGRESLNGWLKDLSQERIDTQDILFTKVVVTMVLNQSPTDYLDAQRAAHIARMRELTNQRRDGNPAQALQADYAIFHLEADLRWMEATAARLQEII